MYVYVFNVNRCSFIKHFLAESPSMEEVDIDSLVESLELRKDKSVSIPTCISSVMQMKPRTLFFSIVVLLKSNTSFIPLSGVGCLDQLTLLGYFKHPIYSKTISIYGVISIFSDPKSQLCKLMIWLCYREIKVFLGIHSDVMNDLDPCSSRNRDCNLIKDYMLIWVFLQLF